MKEPKFHRSMSEAFPDERADSGDWNHPRSKNVGLWVVDKFCLWGLIIVVVCLLIGML